MAPSFPSGSRGWPRLSPGSRGWPRLSPSFCPATAATNYDLGIYLGRAGYEFDQTEVTVEGVGTQIAPDLGTGQFTRFDVTGANDANTDGYIAITFRDAGGIYQTGFAVNGIDIAETTTGLSGAATLLAGSAVGGGAASIVSASDLTTALNVAAMAFSQTGLSAAQQASISSVVITVASLEAGVLAKAGNGRILIDDDAAGFGWSLAADPVAGHFDLLTAVAHELGHLLGYEHSDIVNEVMNTSLDAGTRHDSHDGLDDFFGNALETLHPFE